MKNMSSLMN